MSATTLLPWFFLYGGTALVQSRKTVVACKIADAFTNENYNSHFCLHYIHHLIQVHTSFLCIWIQCCVPNEETCNLLCSIGHVLHINFASICEWMCTCWVWNINWSRTRCDVFHFRKSGKTFMTQCCIFHDVFILKHRTFSFT